MQLSMVTARAPERFGVIGRLLRCSFLLVVFASTCGNMRFSRKIEARR